MTTTAAQDEFIQQHAEHGNLSPQQAAQLLELATEQGDTGAKPELDAKPDATTAQEDAKPNGGTDDKTNDTNTADAGAPTGATTDEPTDPAKAVIQAKDGVHTIPYQKLVDAREGEKTWKAKAEQAQIDVAAAQTELDALKAQAQQRADAGVAPTKVDNQVAAAQAAIDQGADPALFGDFSEEGLAKGIKLLVDQQVAAKVGEALAPLRQQQQVTAQQSHYQLIYEKHPDADSIAESKELQDWIGQQPKFAQDAYRGVLDKGDQASVIELFDTFKSSTGRTQAAAGATPQGDAKAQAKAAIQAAQPVVPASLSGIPGGRPGPGSAEDVLADLSGPDLAERMASMSPAQIEAYLNRQI